VRLEGTRRRKFAKFMSHHVFRDVNGHKRLSVVDAERVAYKVRRDRRATRPGLDRLLRAGFDGLLDLLEQVIIDEETLLDGASHGAKGKGLFLTTRLAAVVVDDDLRVGRLGPATRRKSLGELAPR
jgi:hypothetical protein